MDHGSVSDRSESPSPNYLARVCRNNNGASAIHHLEEHLRAVADRAEEEPR